MQRFSARVRRVAIRSKIIALNAALVGLSALFLLIEMPRASWMSADAQYRYLALILQVLGGVVAWFDLTGAAKAHGIPGAWTRTVDLLRELFAPRGATLEAEAISVSAVVLGGCLTTVPQLGPSPTLDQRLAALEVVAKELRRDVDSNFKDLRQAESALRGMLNVEASQRAACDTELRERLRDSVVGNHSALSSAAFWVLVGTIVSALAPEIAALHEWVRHR